jgi:hypothetical protein
VRRPRSRVILAVEAMPLVNRPAAGASFRRC